MCPIGCSCGIPASVLAADTVKTFPVLTVTMIAIPERSFSLLNSLNLSEPKTRLLLHLKRFSVAHVETEIPIEFQNKQTNIICWKAVLFLTDWII